MGFKSFRLELEVRDDAPPPAFATAIPQMFEALLDVFAPLDVTYAIDHGDFMHIRRIDPARAFGHEPLWCDEELTRDALTRCKPGLGTDVVTELYDRFANLAPKSFYISAEGALRHRAPGTDEPAWYGRWRSTHLHELYTFSFTWTKDRWRGFELKCPLSGYPFTSVRPLVRGSLADGDPAIAAENRALLFPALAKVRSALGFDPHEVEWGHDVADYGPLFPDDARDIAKRWLPFLAASLVLLFACKKPAPQAPVIEIDLIWPGASTEVLEQAAVTPIEQAVAPFAHTIESRITADHATVQLEVEDLDRALVDVQRAMPLRTLPPGLQPPTIRKTHKDDVPVMWLALGGKLPPVDLSQVMHDEVLPKLQRVIGVAKIDVRNLSERTTVVRPDLVKLDAAGVVVSDLIAALQSRSTDVPGGRITTGPQTIRIDDAPHDPTSVGELVVRQVNGAPVRMRDVTIVEETVDHDGEATLAIYAYDPAHAREVIDRVRAVISKAPPAVTIVETKSPLPPRRTPQLVVQLRGPDLTALSTAADAITAQLATRGIRDVVRDPEQVKADERVTVHRERADALGVAIPEVLATLEVLRGVPVGPISVRFTPEKLADQLARLRVRGRDGLLVPISDIASVEPGETGAILRRDRERTIELSVYADNAREIVKSYKPPADVRVILLP